MRKDALFVGSFALVALSWLAATPSRLAAG